MVQSASIVWNHGPQLHGAHLPPQWSGCTGHKMLTAFSHPPAVAIYDSNYVEFVADLFRAYSAAFLDGPAFAHDQ